MCDALEGRVRLRGHASFPRLRPRGADRPYLHAHFLVAGIVITAVGDEFELAHADGHTDLKTAPALHGGPGLMEIPAPSLIVLSWLATGLLVMVAIWETVIYQQRQPRAFAAHKQ